MIEAPISITVVMLTYNEEIHIERCLRSLQRIASKIFIVDSYSMDRTVDIAESLGAVVVQRKWKNYADQFQWGLDHCGDESEWVMRMDADEYLEPALQQEILLRLPSLTDVGGVYINRKQFFYGKWIKHGGRYPLTLLRIWRNGQGRIEQRWMDEHIILTGDARTVILDGNLVDDNLKGISFFVDKHNSYATREAVDVLNQKYNLFKKDESIKLTNDPQAKRKRLLKDGVYSKLPIALRSMFYFIFRYVFQLGFLDGGKGFIYHFMQGYWYRMLVDIKIMEIEERSDGDAVKMKQILAEEYGIKL